MDQPLLTPTQLMAAREMASRILMERHLHEFVRGAFHIVCPGEQFIDGWHIGAICLHLEAVVDGRIQEIIINVPPGTMKSLLVGVFWPAWCWADRRRRHLKFMFASYAADLSQRDSVLCRHLVQSQWYQDRWPIALSDDQNTKGKWVNLDGGWRFATSVGGKGTGEHPDIKCLHPKSKVLTRLGLVAAKDLRREEEVLSYNHHTKVKEWKRALVSMTPSQPCVALRTRSGLELWCTFNHPVFVVGRGYVWAGTVQPGEKVLAYDCEMRNLRMQHKQNSSPRREEQKTFLLAPLSWDIHHRPSPPEQQWIPRVQVPDVPKGVSHSRVRGGPAAKILLNILLSCTKTENQSYQTVRALWEAYGVKAVYSKKEEVLFTRLCGKDSNNPSVWPHERSLDQRWQYQAVQVGVLARKAPGALTGWKHMCLVQDSPQGLRQGDGRPPYQLRQEKQLNGELGDALPILSRTSSRWSVEQDGLEAEIVESVITLPQPDCCYNVAVEGNHNFYADGLLTHNCADDPHNTMQAVSEAERQQATDWWDSTMTMRGALKGSRSVVVMQRLHELDLSGHLLRGDTGWTHLCLPMRYEPPSEDPTTKELVPRMPVTPIGWQDPRTKPGELLWPAGYDDAKVARLEAKLGNNAPGQLQQRPTPKGGREFQRTWFKVVDVLPPGIRKWVRYWDKASLATGHGAESASVLMGLYEVEHPVKEMRDRYVIADAYTFRKTWADREAAIKQQAVIDRAMYGHVETWVEQEPGSGGKESAEATVARNPGQTFKIERVTGSKVSRAGPLASQASVGKVSILAGSWNRQLLDEFENFPVGALKDLVDGSSGAFNKLFQPTTGIRPGDIRGGPTGPRMGTDREDGEDSNVITKDDL